MTTKKIIPFLIIITSLLVIAKFALLIFAPPKFKDDNLPILKKYLPAQSGKITVPILTYHHIRNGKPTDNYSVPPEIFDQQMAWLKDNGYQIISYSQFYQTLTSSTTPPEKSVVISFDDGYKDQYVNALPILKKYGYSAIFFINYNKIGWWNFMSWDMLKSLLNEKMEIGSHSLSHKNLTDIDLKNAIYSIRQGKLKLEYRLGIPVYHFAYPNGEFSRQIIEEVKNASFWSALSNRGSAVHDRANGPYAISRTHVENNLESFKKIFQ